MTMTETPVDIRPEGFGPHVSKFLAVAVKPRLHRQQCRSNIIECYKSNDSFDKVEFSFDKVKCCFDIIAVFGNNVE